MKHAIAQIRWLPEHEGGRRTPVTGSRYMSPAEIAGLGTERGTWTLVVHRSQEQPRDEETVLVHFLMDDAPHDALAEGVSFHLTEGATRVAEGVVSEVFDLVGTE